MPTIPKGVLPETAKIAQKETATKKLSIKDWKTTVIGAVVAIIGITYLCSLITTEQLVSITTFLIATGLIASQDSKKE